MSDGSEKLDAHVLRLVSYLLCVRLYFTLTRSSLLALTVLHSVFTSNLNAMTG